MPLPLDMYGYTGVEGYTGAVPGAVMPASAPAASMTPAQGLNIGTSAIDLASALRAAGKKSTPFKDKVKQIKKTDPDVYYANKRALQKLADKEQKGSGWRGAIGPAIGLAGAVAAPFTGGASLIATQAATAAGAFGANKLAESKAKGEAEMLGNQAQQTFGNLAQPQRQPRLAQPQRGGFGQRPGMGGQAGAMPRMALPQQPQMASAPQKGSGNANQGPFGDQRNAARGRGAPLTVNGQALPGKKGMRDFFNQQLLDQYSKGLGPEWMSLRSNAITGALQDTNSQMDAAFARSGDSAGFHGAMRGGLQMAANQQLGMVPFEYQEARRNYLNDLIKMYRSTRRGGGGYQPPQPSGNDWAATLQGVGTAAKGVADLYGAFKG